MARKGTIRFSTTRSKSGKTGTVRFKKHIPGARARLARKRDARGRFTA